MMTMSEPLRWPPLRIVFWTLMTLVVMAINGPNLVKKFRPDLLLVVDFAQEWLSARNYWIGLPIYSDQKETLRLHLDLTMPKDDPVIRYNAHPPVAVLLAVPFGKLDYPDAMLVWNLATFALFLVAVVLVIRELKMPFTVWSLLPTTAIIIGSYPVYFQIAEGQLNCLLVFLLVVGWVADRRDQQVWAGIAVGAAGAIKLFPLFLLVYFVLARRWLAIVALGITFLVLNAAAAIVLGTDTFHFYITYVVPSVAERFETSIANSSISGFWLRFFSSHPDTGVLPLVHEPLLALVAANVLRAVVVLITAWVTWRTDSVSSRDHAFAVALIAMLLVSPITWPHYFVLLVLPACLIWMRIKGRVLRVLMWLVFLILLLPDRVGLYIVRGLEQGVLIGTTDQIPPIPAIEGLYTVALQHYALVGLFLLTLRVVAKPSGAQPLVTGRGG